jgi:hypothetical protein
MLALSVTVCYDRCMIEDVPKIATATRTFRIPSNVLEQVQTLAAIETRSVNEQVVQLIKEALAARGTKP